MIKQQNMIHALAIVVLSAATITSYAQEGAGLIEEIVVTANKREQSLQDVPGSVTALSQATLENRNISNLADLVPSIPGLGYESEGPTGGQAGQRFLNLRGVGADNALDAETVGFYINETNTRFIDPHLFDVNRIEVLKGPQGTLYGAGSMGGTLKIVTNDPDPTQFYGRIKTGLAQVNKGELGYGVDGLVNIPLGTDAALRAMAFGTEQGGYIDNVLDADTTVKDINDTKSYGGRVALLYDVTNALTLKASYFREERTVDGESRYTTLLDPAALFPWQSLLPIADRFSGDNLITHRPLEIAEGASEDFDLIDVTVEYDFGFATLTATGSRYTYQTVDYIDHSQFLGPINLYTDIDEEGYATEIRLLSNPSDTFDWLVGLYYADVEEELTSLLEDQGLLFVSVDEIGKQEQIALFGELVYHVNYKLDITLGLRWFDYDTSSRTVRDGLFVPPGEDTLEASGNEFTPRVILSYEIAPDHNAYITAAKGSRLGRGLSVLPATCGDAVTQTQVEPDSLWSYEVGYKAGELAGGKMSFNASGYYIDWKNTPQAILLDCGFEITENVGGAEVKGGDVEITIAPTDKLVLTAGASYVDATLTEDAPLINAAAGDRLIRVPKWKASFSGTYTWPATDRVEAYASANLQYTGDSTAGFDFSNPQAEFFNTRDSYTTLGFRVGARFGRWEIAAFGANMLDERPRLGTFQFVTPELFVGTFRPRTIGLEVDIHFD